MNQNPIIKALQAELAKERDKLGNDNSIYYMGVEPGQTPGDVCQLAYEKYTDGHEAATARLLSIVERALGVIEKYEPYCVPMWVDSELPEYKTIKEVWLAREFLTTLADASGEIEKENK